MGDIITKYVIPGLEVAGGAVSEVFAPGNPVGLGLMANGTGQLAGGAAGGSQGQSIGGSIGSLVGAGSGSFGGLDSAFGQGASGADLLSQVTGSSQMPDMSTLLDVGAGVGSPSGTTGTAASTGSTGSFLKSISDLLGTGSNIAGAITPTKQRQPGQAPAPVNARGKGGQGISAPALIQDQNFKPQSMAAAAKALSAGASPQLIALFQKLMSNASATG